MKIYKNKSTALKHINNGKSFTNQVFRDFWTNKEVCWEVLCRDPSLFWFVERHNPNIRWDSEFMGSCFLIMLLNKSPYFHLHLSEIGPYLPPEITDSKEVALLAAKFRHCGYDSYFAPDLLLDADIRRAYGHDKHSPKRSLSKELISVLSDRTDLVIDLINAEPTLYSLLPENLQSRRDVQATICAATSNFRFAVGGLYDQEDFVLEVLKRDETECQKAFHSCSYRIRKAVGEQDPLKYLESVVQAKTLQALLPTKANSLEPKQKALKI
ncbi:hypothetical protein [Limnohabitans sp.]|uniref:hypothetical protein n=1 Tax=Limnohabitans sp. TaxID=1907725 RepID=UPI0035B03365